MLLQEKHCLVTGGAGFIGSHLVDKLIEKGCRVRVLDNLSNGKRSNIEHHESSQNFEFMEGDVADQKDASSALADIDVVFHLACLGVRHSLSFPLENQRTNGTGTLVICEAARQAGVEKFIYCSSSEIYGTAETVPMDENHPTKPSTVYGASKLAGEKYTLAYHEAYGMNTMVIRPFNTYGPRSHYEGDSGEMIPKSIVRALGGREILIFGDGSQTRDFTYVEDTAQGFIAAAESEKMIGQVFNIGSRFEISIKNLAQKLVEKIGNPDVKMNFTDDRPGDVLRLYSDPTVFMELCEWLPKTNFEEGLDKTINYFRNHPFGIDKLNQLEIGRNWKI
jgi:UDP-glucose 4-epimerase